jgi:hypothetical protein
LLSGVAVTALQDVIDNFYNDNISKKNNDDVTLLSRYNGSKNFGSLYAPATSLRRCLHGASIPSGRGLFCVPYCMHDHQEAKETEGEQSAGQRPCQMGERRRCAWPGIGTESRPARAPLRGRGAYLAVPWGGGAPAVE